MRKILIIIIAMLLQFSIVSADNMTKVYINNREIKFTVSPVTINNRTMVQVRPIFEALGIEVNYYENTRTIIGVKDKKIIELKLDSNKADIMGSEHILDAPATSINGSVLVPLRFIAESLKAKVEVDTKTNSIFITMPNTSLYNTDNLRYDADFKLQVDNGVYWVPANRLGMPQLTKEDITKLVDTFGYKEKINTVYDLMLFIQTKGIQSADGNAKVEYQNLYWEIPRPADYSIRTKASNCYGLSEMTDYLLDGDYEEVGFLHIGEMGGGHVINYIKNNSKYYVFDLTAYIQDNLMVGEETGDYSDYYRKNIIANIHEVDSLEGYTKYFIKKVNRRPGFITTFKDEFPVSSYMKNGNWTYYYPTNTEYTILYDDQEDNVGLSTMPAPSMEGVYK